MLVSASWVLPISAEPIENGAVLIRGSRIVKVGTAADLAKEYPDEKHHDHPGCVLLPGLVNAHTHLAMTCLHGVIPSRPFTEWLAEVPRAWRALSPDDIAASIAFGAAHCLTCGVTVVGDIAYGAESIATCADMGLGGVFYWEVLGVAEENLAETLHDAEFPLDPSWRLGTRMRVGVSPHSGYTSGPGVLQATHRLATAQNAGYALHVAESPAETSLMRSGTGPLTELSRRLAVGFESPGVTPVAYLDRLGVLDGAAAVHCVDVKTRDISILVRKTIGAVLCPRSNAYLQVGPAPVAQLAGSRLPIAIGTDSLASNEDLDLFEEARTLQALHGGLTARDLVEMMTQTGARVLGLEGSFGVLAPEAQADMAVFRVSGNDPYEALMDQGGRRTARAVMSAGIWRMLEGSPTFGISVIERANHLAGQRATAALRAETL